MPVVTKQIDLILGGHVSRNWREPEVFPKGKMCRLTASKTSLKNSVWIMSKGHDEYLND